MDKRATPRPAANRRVTARAGAVALAAALVAAGGPALARDMPVARPDAAASAAAEEAAAEARKRAREAELEAVRRSINVSERRQADMKDEIAEIEADRARLTGMLIETAQRLRQTQAQIDGIEERLDHLHAGEDAIRRSLESRRDVLAEILAALQRMGRSPPPALLARPEDALSAIRGSILAGAVLPDIRIEAEALAADLAELGELGARIEAERETLTNRYAALGEERTRINLLVASKGRQRGETEAALEAERQRAAELAAKAIDLEGLIAAMEEGLEATARAAEEARAAATEAAPADSPEAARQRLADTGRLTPALAFPEARGLLPLPVVGPALLRYGEEDGLGGRAQGLSISARPGAPVVSPTDGWVVYAGPFRSYGELLIINAGDGYHVVLAGMSAIHASLGQFVLAGEPVAEMGGTRLVSLGEIDHSSAQPVLYVEFRKDGNAIDPGPWWDRHSDEEVRG